MSPKGWEKLTTVSIKYDIYTLTEFINMVRQGIPEDTKNEDIQLDFDAYESAVGYYDETVVESTLTISIRK